MTGWTAPPADRTDPDRLGDERSSLEAWVDFHRATLLGKCSGLTAGQLKEAAVPPSGLTLLGLVRHMSEVERWWFRRHVGGEDLDEIYCTPDQPELDFYGLPDADAPGDLDLFAAEVAASRAACAGHDLDEVVPSRGHRKDVRLNVRWVYLHMIEEYARHNGHADLLRQRIDGATGD
ncbi:MAG: DinB family protein [Actinomycetes bacterium]